jgi:hypothetical protein
MKLKKAPVTRLAFEVRPHATYGVWESNDRKYRSYAHELLKELEQLCEEVSSGWPINAGRAITNEAEHPELWKRAEHRDRTSDAVRVYAAMAIEGFLNLYGLVRLGQKVYDDHFERLALVPKLRSLLLLCDKLDVPKNDSLVLLLDQVAQSRNALVHPKAKEIVGEPSSHVRTSTKLPEVAQESVKNMEAFFEQFSLAVPDAAHQIGPRPLVK